MLEYWMHAIQVAWGDTWELICGGFKTAMFGALIFILSTVLAHAVRGKERSMEWLLDGFFGALSTAIIGGIAFMAYLLFWIPAQTYRDYASERALNVTIQSEKASIQADLKDETKRNTNLTDALLKANGQQADPDEWPPLTDAQIEQWAKQLQGSGLKELVIIANPNTQDNRLFRSLQKLGRKISCNVMSSTPLSIGDPESSIVIYSSDNDPAAPVLGKLFGQMTKTRMGGGSLAAPHEISIFVPDKSAATPP